MRLTTRLLKKVNIYSGTACGEDYVGKRIIPEPLGFVYAEIFPQTQELKDKRRGKYVNSSAVLFLRPGAGVRCGDLAGVWSDSPDSRILEISRYPGHLTVRTERIA